MVNTLTAEQEQVIMELTGEQADAVFVFGTDLYTEGMIKGAMTACGAVAVGALGTALVSALMKLAIHKHKQSKGAEGQK